MPEFVKVFKDCQIVAQIDVIDVLVPFKLYIGFWVAVLLLLLFALLLYLHQDHIKYMGVVNSEFSRQFRIYCFTFFILLLKYIYLLTDFPLQ